MNLTFHQTFSLNFAEIASFIEVIRENPTIDNFEISNLTGIGIGAKDPRKGKVQPTIKWAEFGGLVNLSDKGEKREIKLNPDAEVILKEDPHLRSLVTKWFFHYNLSRPDPCSAWHFFVHKFLTERYEFTREDVIYGLQGEFRGAQISSINPGVLLNSYLKENSMQPLGLIQKIKTDQYRKGSLSIPNPFITGYILSKIWEREHPKSLTIGFDLLETPAHLIQTMHISQDIALEHLEILKNNCIIDLNRSVRPFQIVKLWQNPIEILMKACDERNER